METGNHGHDLLEWAISERYEIKLVMDKLETRLKNVNSAAVATMESLKIPSFKNDLGTLCLKEGGVSHRIDKGKLAEALLGFGLSADKVAAIMEAADKTSIRQSSVAFTPDRTDPRE